MTVRKNENGKSNCHYDNSCGTLNMAPGTKDVDVKNRVTQNNSATNNKEDNKCSSCPRMTWSVDADGNSELSDSNAKFVIDGHKKGKIRCNKCSHKLILWALLILFGITIAAITSLYIMERNKEKILKYMEKNHSPPCFNRATPKQIENLTEEPEILLAINESNRLLQLLQKDNSFHAVSLSVSYMGQTIWSFNHGTKNFSNKITLVNITNDTPYPIASISKVFTVIMLQKLLDDRSINSIDDDVNTYVPSLQIINPFDKKKITFRHLACMMSGLPREAPCYSPQLVLINDSHSEIDIMCPYNSSEMLERLRKVSLILPPGLRPSYSNLAVAVLGDVLSRIKKVKLEAWVEENIIKPLNLTNTGYISAEKKDYFPVTSLAGGINAPIIDWGWLRSAAGMYSSTNDLGKLGAFFLTDSNTILNKKSIESLFQPAYIWSDGTAQGCPFEMQPIDFRGNRQLDYMSYDKNGYTFGYGSIFRLIPTLKLNLNFLVASSDEKSVYICRDIVNTKFIKAFDKLLKRKGPKYKLPPNAEVYVGTYKLSTYWPLIRKPCKVTLENGMLILRIEWMAVPLSHDKEWTLQTGLYGRFPYSCLILSSGLISERYVFTPPGKSETHSPGFYVNGISSAGYIRFDRISD